MSKQRPVGEIVKPLPPGSKPDLRPLHGRWVVLAPLTVARHAQGLFQSTVGADEVWTWMPYGPFVGLDSFAAWALEKSAARDPWFYAIVSRDGEKPVGMCAFMRSDAANGVLEIGNIWMSPALQKTRAATESIYLMIRHAFDDLGVRRLEWKCDSLNQPSRNAAQRFGFKFEGIFRQHMIIKGRNRDTAWFAMLDKDWPRIRAGFETWLADNNFDAEGQQKAKLQLT